MARDKVLKTRRIRRPVKLQDGRALDDLIGAAIGSGVDTVIERVETLERTFQLLEGGLQMFTADVTLRAGDTGGRLCVPIEVDEEFIGMPVIVTEQPGGRSDHEFGIVLFVGTVLDERTLELTWFASEGAPSRTQIAYILGTAGRL